MLKQFSSYLKSSVLLDNKIVVILVLLISITTYAQETVRIMTYNLCEYPNTEQYGDASFRNPYFRTIINDVNPDILCVEEMHGETYANNFLANVLNYSETSYAMADFVLNVADNDDNNVLYYKTSKFSLIPGSYIIDDIGHVTVKFKLYNINTRDTLTIYSIHLASGEENGERYTQAVKIRESSDSLSSSEYFIGVGDFNMYGGTEITEPAYYIFDTNTGGYFIDPQGLDDLDNWSDNS